jgi:predicted Zn-dependent protease
MFLSTVLMLIVLAVVLGSTTLATDEPGTPVPATIVVVKPGQTLWDLAAKANPDGNVQDTVAGIMRLNSIESAGALQAGDTIAVPLYK